METSVSSRELVVRCKPSRDLMVASLASTSASAASGVLVMKRSAASRRDPRAAPLYVQRNVPTAESCEFYGFKDAISGCRRPRSCRDCLAMSGCMLTTDGRCKALDPSVVVYDPASTVDTASQPIELKSNRSAPVFAADTTDYCAADDPSCVRCRPQFQQLAATKSVFGDWQWLFCTGEAGCVCTSVCEASAYRESTVYDEACGQPAPLVKRSLPLPQFSTLLRDPRAPLSSKMHNRMGRATCTFREDLDIQGCRPTRGAYECLDAKACMIAGSTCISANGYVGGYDYLGKTQLSMLSAQFPSSNTTICVANDASCASCSPSIFASSCVGLSGCVCDQYMKYLNPLVAGSVVDGECRPFDTTSSAARLATGAIIAFTTLLIAITWLLCVNRDQFRRPATEAALLFRQMLDQFPAHLELDLFGWRRFYHELRAKEQQLLQGEDNLSPVSRPMDLEFALVPSAPEFDDQDGPTAPTNANPMALASAPAYRCHDTPELDNAAPSAPEFS